MSNHQKNASTANSTPKNSLPPQFEIFCALVGLRSFACFVSVIVRRRLVLPFFGCDRAGLRARAVFVRPCDHWGPGDSAHSLEELADLRQVLEVGLLVALDVSDVAAPPRIPSRSALQPDPCYKRLYDVFATHSDWLHRSRRMPVCIMVPTYICMTNLKSSYHVPVTFW